MGCKTGLNNSSMATGYWGGNIYNNIENEQMPSKIRALLQDKLLSRGKDVYLWQKVTEDTPNSIECSCYKETSERSDVACNSCYGTIWIPGYIKFLHETLYMSSISSGISLINVTVDSSIKPHRILLADGELSGSIISPRIQFSNPFELDWDYKVNAPNILETNQVSASFSFDGINYFPIEQLNTQKPVGIGGIYIKISLSRQSINDRSPEFEIIRIRHGNTESPYIKILRPQVFEIPSLLSYGRRVENAAERFWTVPLDFFDSTIPANTQLALILENSFYQRITGINQHRYVITKPSYDEEFGVLTQQSFETRRVQIGEMYEHLVF